MLLTCTAAYQGELRQGVSQQDGSARVTLIGHATLLIQIAGLNILTAPVWSDRASPLSFVGPKRVTPPSFGMQNLPPINSVLISHNHYDHLDTASLAQLHARDKPRGIVPLGNAKLVQAVMPQSQVSEHDWREAVKFSSATGTATIHVEPMLHSSVLNDLHAYQCFASGGRLVFVKAYEVGYS